MKSVSKYIVLTYFLVLYFSVYGQNNKGTQKYAGTYSYNPVNFANPFGILLIYPESDTTLLFYIENGSGKPSEATGIVYGRIIIKHDSGIFFLDNSDEFMNCKLYFKFFARKVRITTITGHEDCGYGHGVYSDGIYYRRSAKIPKYFIWGGDTTYFGKKTLKKWYKTN